ncbi:DEAD/DEAH box helicase [Sphingomonas abietis]|uniref:Helicase ATP-binding domain-containing protein n=1 Tax=Sphingomonas abietis TaxID=3012344 RepID=A0ABY7NNT7_9SPHN|nr:helicase-related protein [Sphingomonas abietis]WBO22303.1 hypothetical protein PBT88_19505 [Sphingomonas abietis]
MLFVVDAISLIDQTVEAFYAQGVSDIGVIQADHPMTDWSKPVQIASVQTLRSRDKLPPAELVIVDEAHCQDEWLISVMAEHDWEDVPFIGLSATPWSKGLGNVYDELITPITMQELIDLGLLSTFRVFAASHPDLTGVKSVAGEFHQGQLSDTMSDGQLVADVVETYLRLGDARPAFAFCVDRAHAKKLQQRFEVAGVGCGYIDAYTPVRERKAIKASLDTGAISVVCNVGCLTKGVDWAIGCVILARPTRSEMLYVQMVGRGLRVNDGIPDCIILDHADNTLRMGFVTDIRKDAMCTAKKGERSKSERATPLPKECSKCQYLKPAKVALCPACGFKPERQSDVQEQDGELVEVKRGKAKPKASMHDKQAWLSGLNWIARERGYQSGWVSNAFRKKFETWPPNQLDRSMVREPLPEVRNYVRAQMIRYAKGQRA